jgi:hypothetical protein
MTAKAFQSVVNSNFKAHVHDIRGAWGLTFFVVAAVATTPWRLAISTGVLGSGT